MAFFYYMTLILFHTAVYYFSDKQSFIEVQQSQFVQEK